MDSKGHRHRIRCVGLVVEQGKILMVLHKHQTRERFWLMPPGGGLVEGEDILSCAVREVREETGLTVRPSRVVYIREFLEDERGYHNLEVYVLMERTGGTLICGRDPEETVQYIQNTGFYSREELRDSGITIHPAILLDRFWKDYADNFPADALYLGKQNVTEEER